MPLLFASIHGHLDSSSGVALVTREMLELLASRGMDCRVLSAVTAKVPGAVMLL